MFSVSYYKWGAKFYDRFWGNFTAKTLDHTLRTLDLADLGSDQKQPVYLLDIACGTGELELRLLSLNAHIQLKIIGMDNSAEMMTQAKHKLEEYTQNVSLLKGNALLPLPFSDNSFDVVVFANALHYIARPEKLLKEVERILKPGGQLVIEDFTVTNHFFWRIFERIIRLFDPQFHKTYTQAELTQIVGKTRLVIKDSGNFKIDFLWCGMFVKAIMPL